MKTQKHRKSSKATTPKTKGINECRFSSVLLQDISLSEWFFQNLREVVCVSRPAKAFNSVSVQAVSVQISSAWFSLIRFSSPGNGSDRWQRSSHVLHVCTSVVYVYLRCDVSIFSTSCIVAGSMWHNQHHLLLLLMKCRRRPGQCS